MGPVNKKRKENEQRPKKCVIRIDSQVDDNKLSAFYKQSCEVILQSYYVCVRRSDNKLSAFSEQSCKVILQSYYVCVRRSESDIFILCQVHATGFCV